MDEGKAGAEGINSRTIPAMIKRSVQHFGEMPALCRKLDEVWVPISYADLDRAATCFACGLIRLLGVRKGDHVALIADNRPEWMIADLGIHYAGAVDIPRGADTPTQILEAIVRHSDARFAIVENAELLEKIRPLLSELQGIVVLDPPSAGQSLPANAHTYAELMVEGERDTFAAEELVGERLTQLRSEDLATIIYTSGTAGNPKGVMIAHRHYLHNIQTVPGLLGNDSTDKSLAFLPIWHAFERMIEYIILSVGASVYYSNLAGLRDHLVEVRPTVLVTVPDFWVSVYKVFLRKATAESRLKRVLVGSLLASAIRYRRAFRLLHGNQPRFNPEERPSTWSILHARFNCFCLAPVFRLTDRLLFRRLWESLGGQLKTVSIGAGPLPAKIDEFLDAAGINVVEGYGLTEAMVIIAFRDAQHKRFQTVGGVLPGLELQIVDENGNPLGPGVVGRIRFRGPTLMLGYYKDPQLTAAVIDRDGWFDTGDTGVWTVDSCLRVLGRADDTLVLTNGEKVNAVMLENELRGESLVERAVVVGQGRPFVASFLFPQPQELAALAKQKGISFQRVEELATNPQILAEYQALCDRVSANRQKFTVHERIRRFRLVFWRLDVGKELSQSMKLRRAELARLHQREIDGLYRTG